MRTRPYKKTFFSKVNDFFYVYGSSIAYSICILIVGTMFYFLIIPTKWKKEKNEKHLYRNEKLIIVGTNEAAQDFTHDKFHRPIVIKVWLVQRVKDTTQFAEIDSHWDDGDFYITNELWYSKSIGDTLYFDYIRRGRFFTINKK